MFIPNFQVSIEFSIDVLFAWKNGMGHFRNAFFAFFMIFKAGVVQVQFSPELVASYTQWVFHWG